MAVKKILIAPSAFKGTMSPATVARAISNGIKEVAPHAECQLLPLADGGDGTIEAIYLAVGGKREQIWVKGPRLKPVLASWLKLENLAVVELASACGIALLEGEKLNPLDAHTMGLGEVLMHCLSNGEDDIVVTLGGSASTDGGTGALRALGARFFDESKNDLPLGGGALVGLSSCDLSSLQKWLGMVRFRVATDVLNPLLGDNGASRVFAPQKGANESEVEILEQGLLRLADVLEAFSGKRLREIPGSGAAGGAAFGLALGLNAEIISGSVWIAELVGLKEKIAACDLVITAEGRLDTQSLSGKATGELARMCAAMNRRLWVIPAQVEPGIDWTEYSIERVVPVNPEGKTASVDDLVKAVRVAWKLG